MQNMGILVKNLVISKNSSNFVPEKVGRFSNLMLGVDSRIPNPEKINNNKITFLIKQ